MKLIEKNSIFIKRNEFNKILELVAQTIESHLENIKNKIGYYQKAKVLDFIYAYQSLKLIILYSHAYITH